LLRSWLALVIARPVQPFERFPYRNPVLGRSSSAEENDFLRNGPRFGQ